MKTYDVWAFSEPGPVLGTGTLSLCCRGTRIPGTGSACSDHPLLEHHRVLVPSNIWSLVCSPYQMVSSDGIH